MTYGPPVVRPEGRVCDDCGAIVVYTVAHDEFHALLREVEEARNEMLEFLSQSGWDQREDAMHSEEQP